GWPPWRAPGLMLTLDSETVIGPQPGSLNEPIRVCQLFNPSTAKYSPAYQKVQSSTGSTTSELSVPNSPAERSGSVSEPVPSTRWASPWLITPAGSPGTRPVKRTPGCVLTLEAKTPRPMLPSRSMAIEPSQRYVAVWA